MANPIKHVGRIVNTGRRCIVVFREIYNETGEVVDGDSCLVVETDGLPDAMHESIIRMVESEPAQRTGNFFEVLTRERFPDGSNALNYLHTSKRLRKFPTSQIELTPDVNTKLKLSVLNKIIRMQESGATQAQIENAIQDDSDQAPRESQSTAKFDSTQTIDQAVDTAEAVLDDTAIAQNMLTQAETFLAEAERLKAEAYEMAPELKPKRGRPKKSA